MEGTLLDGKNGVHFLLNPLDVVYVINIPKPMESNDETLEKLRRDKNGRWMMKYVEVTS